MSWEACAEQVQSGDPDRFLSAMTAEPAARARLFPLYAFNLEVARAPWVTSEPTIAEIRLQWWRDAVSEVFENRPVRRHEVTTPLAQTISECGLPRALFDAAIDARRFDIDGGNPESRHALWVYLENTAGGLAELSALALGANADQAEAARLAGTAHGLASYLTALPALYEANHMALAVAGNPKPGSVPAEICEEISALSEEGLDILNRARATKTPAPLRPAFLAGWQTARILETAQHGPQAVFEGGLSVSEFRRKTSLLRAQITGRW